MPKTFICALLLASVLVCAAFETEPIAVASHKILRPPLNARQTAKLVVADNLPRVAIAFDFPQNFLLSTTAILEALLVVKIIPDEKIDGKIPYPIYCLPLTEDMNSSRAWTEIPEELLGVSELGFYDPETGTVFFEIAHMLQQGAIGKVPFHGIILVPGKGCPSFKISPVKNAIDFRCAYGIGKREPVE